MGRKVLLVAAAFAAVWHAQQTFVPPPQQPASRQAAPLAAIPAAALLAASPSYADKIGDASKKLGAAAYPFLKSVDWNSDLFAKFPSEPQKTLKAIDKALVMAASIDGKALKAAAEAHHKAIGSVDSKGVTSQADFTAIVDGLGRVVAGVPEKQVLDVFYAFADIAPKTLPEYIFKTVDGAAAYKAAGAFFEFKDAVKAAR